MEEEILTLTEELLELFKSRQFQALKQKIADLMPYDIAVFMEAELDDAEQLVFFRLLPKDFASDVFVELAPDTQEAFIHKFTDKELKTVIDDMFLDDTVDIIEEMPANVVKRILKTARAEDKIIINKLLQYPEDSAGSIMTPEFVALRPTMTVAEAFDKIRKNGVNKESIYTCYVTNTKKELIGVTTVKTLLLSNKTDLIGDIMETSLISVDTLEDRESVANKLQNYDFLALPVIDKQGCIVGIITIDDVVDVITEEATEDIHKMAGVAPTEKPYLKESIFSIWKARAPWLIILLITSTFTSMILANYESRLSPILYAFVPMLMGTAGNAGGQTSVTIIRAIAVEGVSFADILKVIFKELMVSLLVGLSVAIICFAKIMLLDRLYHDITIEIALLISAVCLISIVMAKLVGCILPLLAKKIKLDPAVVASPLMTTIVDALSLIIYCSISIAVL